MDPTLKTAEEWYDFWVANGTQLQTLLHMIIQERNDAITFWQQRAIDIETSIEESYLTGSEDD